MRESFPKLSTNRGRYLVLLFLTTLLFISSLVLGTITLYASAPRAERIKHAGIVVQYGDGSVENKCVEFNEGSLSGVELLDRAGFQTTVDASNAMGVAVCKIGGDGCKFPNKPCFCQCQGADCMYWSYWRMSEAGTWTYQQNGASNTGVHNGDVEGWRWGAGATDSANPPTVMTFEQICPLPTETATATDTATATETGLATATFTPTQTGTPTLSRTITPTRTQTLTRTPSLTPTQRAPTQTREIFPTTTRRPIPTARTEFRPKATPTIEFATDPPPPNNSELETPRPTFVAAKRLPTRVSSNSGNGASPGDGEETEVQHNDADVNTGRVLGLVLLGGIAVAGVGLFALVGGVLWWVLHRR